MSISITIEPTSYTRIHRYAVSLLVDSRVVDCVIWDTWDQAIAYADEWAVKEGAEVDLEAGV